MPEADYVDDELYCDAPDCTSRARWFIGLELRGSVSRGHSCCAKHLDEGATQTLLQLSTEGWRLGLRLYPVTAPGSRVWRV